MTRPEGFRHQARKNGDVVIFHHGRMSGVVRGTEGAALLARLARDGADEQAILARVTGNDKRGNERTADQHPRNRR